jgi:DNA-binding CsgD family transcriptional regulator
LALKPETAVPPASDGVLADQARPAPVLLGRRDEQEALDRLLDTARSGRGSVLVVRGEAGVGKTALLDYAARRAVGCHVVRATGVQADMELAFAGLQQMFASMLDPIEHLPEPQREALAVAFGVRSGPAPDRYLVGLAVLGLVAELAEAHPLVCLVDDAQWLDRASAQTLAFVARRLLGESVALVFAVREPCDDPTFAGLPELELRGLSDEDARRLLASVIRGRVDDRVLDRIVAEARGNPLALLELPHGMSARELAGGFAVSPNVPVTAQLERTFLQRVRDLPAATQQLLLLAAAEPVGDPALLLRAAGQLGLGVEAAAPAEAAGLLELRAQVRFRHPVVRSTVYAAATLADRQTVHRALVEATDPQVDPDRRVWHRAQAALGSDEDLASELETSALRAQARGGMAAAAAFLERATLLTPNAGLRARRALAAAWANFLAGAPEAASALLDTASSGPLDEHDEAMVDQLRGCIALHVGRGAEAAELLLNAARRLESIDTGLARETHLEALYAATVAGRRGRGMAEVAAAAQAAPAPPGAQRAADLLLDGLALRFSGDYSASAPILKRALAAFRAEDVHIARDIGWHRLPVRTAADLFDDDSGELLARRQVEGAREAGALGVLPVALIPLATFRVLEGELDAAAALVEETDSLIDATSSRRIGLTKLTLAAYRGDEAEATRLMADVEREAVPLEQGVVLTFIEHARSVLHNALGHYDVAVTAAQQASERDELTTSSWALVELVEAAARSARPDLAADALERLRQRTQVAETAWARGVEARSRALVSDGATADELYREAIVQLSQCRLALELARAHLLYGEWLRRERRRLDAREQLRRAQEMFLGMGAMAFADRATRELLATGERARKRTVETRDELTPHEARIARMARDGASNQEIADQLFVSRKTIEYHLHKVFLKLGITTREHLDRVLPGD